jgi:hypothetical protein
MLALRRVEHVPRSEVLVAEDPMRDAEEITDRAIAPGVADRGAFRARRHHLVGAQQQWC